MNFQGDKTYEIIGCAIEVNRHLGAGYPESDYERAFAYELKKAGFNVQRQYCADFKYKGIKMRKKRIDIIVDDEIVVELKVGYFHKPAHTSQIISYLKTTKLKLGLLIYFNSDRVKIKRVII